MLLVQVEDIYPTDKGGLAIYMAQVYNEFMQHADYMYLESPRVAARDDLLWG